MRKNCRKPEYHNFFAEKRRKLYLVESCSNVLIEFEKIYFMKHLFRELFEANN